MVRRWFPRHRQRWLLRLMIMLPWVAPVSLGTIGWKWILDSIYSVITWVLVWLGFVNQYSPPMWLGEPKLATLDRRHFGTLRPRHVDALELLPA